MAEPAIEATEFATTLGLFANGAPVAEVEVLWRHAPPSPTPWTRGLWTPHFRCLSTGLWTAERMREPTAMQDKAFPLNLSGWCGEGTAFTSFFEAIRAGSLNCLPMQFRSVDAGPTIHARLIIDWTQEAPHPSRPMLFRPIARMELKSLGAIERLRWETLRLASSRLRDELDAAASPAPRAGPNARI